MKSSESLPLFVALAFGACLAPLSSSAQVRSQPVEIDTPVEKPSEYAKPIGYGALEVGRLKKGDGRLRAGEFRDLYTFVGKTGDPVLIDLVSDDFDPYLAIISPSGKVLRNDDWGPTPAARIQARLVEDGAYRVIVTSFRPGEEGTYLLRLQDRRIRIAD
ncbi:MAG: PPC domain-containing protein [Gemmatimonadota bacterium]|nr:PPC domain-containing protein [Gemmatimonadota bacterium]